LESAGELVSGKRIGIAIVLAAAIYGIGLGIGSLLYTTGAIATGATHNDCEDFRKIIAEERGIDEEDVPQSAIKALAIDCLSGHELTEEEAFTTEFLFWPIWPGVIVGAIFLVWPFWAGILRTQEESELAADAPRLEQGT
jgi:hypothetical protein